MRRLSFALLVAFALSGFTSLAQTVSTGEQDVLRPSILEGRLSAILGGGLALSTGPFSTTCDCVFEGGTGFQALAGGSVEYMFGSRASASLLVVGGLERLTFTETDTREEFIQTGERVLVDFERSVVLTLPRISVMARGAWYPGVRGLSLYAGPVLVFSFGDRMKETERITSGGYGYYQSQSNELTYIDGDLSTLYSPNRVRFGYHAGIGYEWPVGETLILRPELSWEHTLTPFVQEYDSWTDSALRLSVAVSLLEW